MGEVAQTLERGETPLETAKRALIAGEMSEAAAAVAALLDREPTSPDGLYIAAVSARRLERFEAAQAYLDRYFGVAPAAGRAWQERGHLARDRGDWRLAFHAYHRACAANPALVGSWIGLAAAADALGRPRDAEGARAEAAWLQALPRDLVRAAELFHDGRGDKAELLCRRVLAERPGQPEAMRLLSAIARQAGAIEAARALLDAALAADPEDPRIRIDHILLRNAEQDMVGAHREAERLYADRPHDPVVRLHLAVQKLNIGAFEESLALFDAAIAAQPDNADAQVSRAHVLKTLGRRDAAIAGFRSAIALQPAHGDAYYGLANLKTFRFTDAERAAMEQALAQSWLLPADRARLHFALGTECEARGEHRGAFDHFSAGNALKLRETGYDADAMHAKLARQRVVFDSALLKARQGEGCPSPAPIFIVGLPRSGSTLIEQILASHPAIDGTMELHVLPALADRLARRRESLAETVASLSGQDLRGLGQDYLAGAEVHRGGAPHFLDKMPNNFRHVGLIRLILPNARIIDARRDPMDCGWSCFKQLFAAGQEFTYGQAEIGRYYRDYVELMEHWDRVAGPNAVLRVQHEEVLADTEHQVRRMLEFLGLPFDPACLDFHRNRRAVHTASSEQVRRPINRDGVGRWQPYAAWLGPLREALGDVAMPPR